MHQGEEGCIVPRELMRSAEEGWEGPGKERTLSTSGDGPDFQQEQVCAGYWWGSF